MIQDYNFNYYFTIILRSIDLLFVKLPDKILHPGQYLIYTVSLDLSLTKALVLLVPVLRRKTQDSGIQLALHSELKIALQLISKLTKISGYTLLYYFDDRMNKEKYLGRGTFSK